VTETVLIRLTRVRADTADVLDRDLRSPFR
jgi:hypothetical protein